MGITEIDQVLMVLGVSTDMSESEKEVVTGLMVDGFDKTAREA